MRGYSVHTIVELRCCSYRSCLTRLTDGRCSNCILHDTRIRRCMVHVYENKLHNTWLISLHAKEKPNAMFGSNSARIGGCVLVQKKHPNYCSYTSTASLNVDGKCSFTNCSATSDGGAIHASGILLNLSGTNVFNSNGAEHLGEDYIHIDPLLTLMETTPLLPIWQDIGVEVSMHKRLT